MWHIRFVLTCLICCAVCPDCVAQFAGASASKVPILGTIDFYKNQLVVEFDPARLNMPVDDLVAATRVGDASELLRSLGSPDSVRLLSRIRAPAAAGLSPAMDEDAERQLQNMVVFNYLTDDATRRAQMDFARHPAVVSQARSVLGHYSTDPLLPIVGDSLRYQWGLYRINAIQSGNPTGIWAQTTGSAYVAMLDNGLQTSGGVHLDLAANYRAHFSYNYGAAHNGATGGSLPTYNVDETPFVNALLVPSAGHGTHTAGIVAARNGNGLGGSGVCPSCSVMAGRVTEIVSNGDGTYYAQPDSAAVATGMSDLVSHGAQVINQSFGLGIDPIAPIDAAIGKAAARDVVIVAASGNQRSPTIDYPANDSRVIAVGGTTSQNAFWDEGVGNKGSNWSESTKVQQFVAPAKGVISSAYSGVDWYPDVPWNCGDNYPAGFMFGYGDCTGTSMASPHVAGLVAMMRSVDPLKSRKYIRDILSATSNTSLCADDSSGSKCELGVPDATKAMTAMRGGSNVLNRKTPLFSFYSTAALDHFYTYVPQMAMAALEQGGLLPQPTAQPLVNYQAIGSTISQYTAYPSATCSPQPCSNVPKAIAVVLTLATNPGGGAPLVPLYRMSYKCGDEGFTNPPNPANPICQTTPSHLSHFYSSDAVAVALYTGYDVNGTYLGGGLGYRLDGIEGYVYSTSVAQPTGTVRLCRKYDPVRDDYILFSGAGSGGLDCSATTDGYTGGNYYQTAGGMDWIGWVYPASSTLGGTQTNAAPVVNVAGPANNSSFKKYALVTISASASDSGGSISNVRFFVDQQFLSPADSSAPYATIWSPQNNGTYALTALATDNRGAVTASAPITVTITGTITPPTFSNSGFETPALGAGNYQYSPPGASWTFTPVSGLGGSGISGNGSAFTFQNPNAPAGAQVGVIQGPVTLSQVLNFASSGIYYLEFSAAQRYSNQTFLALQLRVDGLNVGQPFGPDDDSYQTIQSSTFPITTTGNHTITLVGVNDGYDNTIFFDQMSVRAH